MTGFDRRTILRWGVATGAGAGVLGTSGVVANVGHSVSRYARLGRTGIKISDISFGSSRMSDPKLVRHAFERGVNYFDCAESYKGGRSEKSIGRALAGKRDQVIVTSKAITTPKTGKALLMKNLERSLRRLRTDYIDIYFNHAVNDVARLQNPEWREFTELARKQGKIRFTGISGHGGRLIECLDYALEQDLVDVILVAHNFGQDPAFHQRFTGAFDYVAVQSELPKLLERAHAAGVGTIAMKTLRGAKLNDMRPFEWGGATYAQAAFRWVFASKSVDALVVTMKSREAIDEYVAASGQTTLRKADLRLLDHYVEENDSTYCRPGCDLCHAACPAGVEISEVLRTRMYAVDYGDVAMARGAYEELGSGASPCLSCANPTCAAACPYGLDVSALTRSVPGLLGLS